MTIADFEARSEQDAVRAACIKLLVEPKGLRYEVLPTEGNGKRAMVRIRVYEANVPEDFGGPRASRGPRRRDDGEPRREGAPAAEAPQLGPTEILRAAEKLLSGILERMGMASTITGVNQDGTLELLVDTEDGEALVAGGDESPLAAIQYLVRRVVSHQAQEPIRVVVHIAGLKEERERMLTGVASALADKAVALRKIVRIHPMSAADRRLVHGALSPDPRVETVSENNGPFRRLVIAAK